MSKFFINRPIVAMVIAILMVIVGIVSILGLPIAQFPNIVPPEIQVLAMFTGADALTVQQSVAVPIEQQMSGVDNMNYMYSINANNGSMRLTVDFDITTNIDTDQILTQMRELQASSQLPSDVTKAGVTVQKSTSSPFMLFALYSPNETYDQNFLANYCYINLNDPFTRVSGVASVTIYGAGQYAMRFWVEPDRLAKLGITIPEIIQSVQKQNTVNPAGQIGAEPSPPGQIYTYAVRAQGRLESQEDFEQIVIRATEDGAVVRLKDVARVELGVQTYNLSGKLDGKPAAVIALFQVPGSNALTAAAACRSLMEDAKKNFPPDLDYVVALDTTLSVSAGLKEIIHTLVEALILVIIVVFIFLQGWRATLIPLLAVPVSLIGTFMVFPLLGFSINTLSLFGLVLAIGLVVDDAIVVVEAVEAHIEKGLSPKAAAFKAMEEVGGPVIAIALILAAVFIPTAFIPGITGRLYQQFAVTIAVSVLFSAFNALTLSPALAAMLLRPKVESHGPLQKFFNLFNRAFGASTRGYVGACRFLIRKSVVALFLMIGFVVLTVLLGNKVPSGFLPDEDQGYFYVATQLPNASSLQQTDAFGKIVQSILSSTPGVEHVTTIGGFSLLSSVQNTYSGFFFVTLKPWDDRKAKNEQYQAIKLAVNQKLHGLPGGVAIAFSPPEIPGVGASGGVTFILEDRQGRDVSFLSKNLDVFLAAARKRPEIVSIFSTALPSVPQVAVNVDRDRVLKQGIDISNVYQTLQTFMGGYLLNYFNRFGQQWQVIMQAEGKDRTQAENVGQFYVKNESGDMVPLSALTSTEAASGPEFTMRYNLFGCVQINANAADGYSSAQAMKALEAVFHESMPEGMGFDYLGMSYQENKAAQGVSPTAIFGLSLLFVFLLLAALYESWTLPFSVLLCTPIAIFGAFAALAVGRYEANIYAQIGLIMLIGLAAKNAILIVEFAKLEYENGKPLIEATLLAAQMRLRPILMTSFAFILGCVPLAKATGAGAISRQVMGFTVIGGVLASSFLAIFLIPVFFYLVEKYSGGKKKDKEPQAEGPVAQIEDDKK